MKKIAAFFANRWIVGALGVALLAALIWFGGPLLGFGDAHPLETATARIIFIVLIAGIWLTFEIVRVVRAALANRQISQGIVEEPDPGAMRSAEEVAALRERFEEAVEVLGNTGRGGKKRGLYELPWYIIIGPPGSGKTTALLNSGLRFPLAEKFGDEALRGVGGTRNCDWWFTDDAILLDTAGRYTTQDSEAEVDRAAWEGFLDLLKRHRRRRPINGVLIAISLGDLMTQSEQERFAHARAIRQRIQELDSHFGIRLPVYVMFTKCDLVAGFMEFYEDLGAEEREQVWGMTFPLSDAADGADTRRFPAEFDTLLQRLEARVLARMHTEREAQRRGLIYGFPRQLSSLKPVFGEFIKEVFSGSRFDQAPLLRGVYFTSGTQEGTPIDRVMGAMARAFGIDQRQQAAFTGTGRSYFITRLLRDVVFPESEIAGTNRTVETRRAWLQRATYAGIAGVLVLAVIAWISSFTANSNLIEAAAAATTEAQTRLNNVSPNDRDPETVTDALNALRMLPAGYAERDDRGSFLSGFGLYQGGKLGTQGEAAYRRALMNQLLPRVMYRLEEQVDRNDATVDYTYEALKVYLMLGSEEHYNADAVEAWVAVDWEDAYYGRLEQARFKEMVGHLRAMLAERPVPLPMTLDPGRIAAARARLARMSLEERVYLRMKNAGLADDLPPFTIVDVGGPSAADVFIRKSSKPLSAGISGLFTRLGYDRIFSAPDSMGILTELLAERWVLRDDPVNIAAAELPPLFYRIRDLYFDEYAQSYEELIFDVQLAPFNSAASASRILNILSGPDSPLTQLIAAVATQTTFSLGEGEEQAEDGGGASDLYDKLRRRIGGQVRAPAALEKAGGYANVVEERFADIHRMNEPSASGASPIAYLQGLLRQLADFMMAVERSSGGDGVPEHVVDSGRKAIQQTQSEAARQPNPLVSGILTGAAAGSSNIAFSGLATQINAQWRAGPLEYCRTAIVGRYPLAEGSAEEVRLEDFGEFFGYVGKMETFFNANVLTYVNTTTRPWRLRSNSAIRLSGEAIAMFERADAIKNSFFRGDKQPYVGFELTPISMDASINRFMLTIDGQNISYRHGPVRAELLQWPGPDGTGRVQVEMQPTAGVSMLTERGPWAWFRVLDNADLTPAGRAEQFSAVFTVGGRAARYQLTARSAYNPFKLDELHSFRCMERLTR